jgi:3-hydroxymyristoyl/3-hydroxydecanoyl-(acyl carrier protein) dehydratase
VADRFNAFSFVDRITELEPGVRARGRFHVPGHLGRFPAALVAEAIGQLAAWVSMSELDYRLRPVAGIAAEARLSREVLPGQTLDLAVEIENCNAQDVAYSGTAKVDGRPVVELVHCLGPMLPMADFDDPQAVQQRFELLCGEGARPGRLAELPEFELQALAHEPGRELRALLRVPDAAPFFGDHFPRRPVFPATLLIDAQVRALSELIAEALYWPGDEAARILRLLDLKQRAFVPPGQSLEIQVTLAAPEQGLARARMTAHMDGKRIANARAEIGAEEIDHG